MIKLNMFNQPLMVTRQNRYLADMFPIGQFYSMGR
jgi:hypothetical protein